MHQHLFYSNGCPKASKWAVGEVFIKIFINSFFTPMSVQRPQNELVGEVLLKIFIKSFFALHLVSKDFKVSLKRGFHKNFHQILFHSNECPKTSKWAWRKVFIKKVSSTLFHYECPLTSWWALEEFFSKKISSTHFHSHECKGTS